MTKIMLVGDTHADDSFVANIHAVANLQEVETIVQLGDFGFTFNPNMIASITAWLARDAKRKWYWIDGNHDHHDYIEQVILADEKSWSQPVNMGGMVFGDRVTFPDRMFYCPRGSIFRLGEKLVLALGGAYSIDKHYRTLGVSYWDQEMLRYSDMDRAIHNVELCGRPDVMLTHDAPPSEWLEENLETNGYKVGPESKGNRKALATVVDRVRPTKLYHGHYHWRYSTTYTTNEGWDVGIEGVAANVTMTVRGQTLDSSARPDYNYLIEEW